MSRSELRDVRTESRRPARVDGPAGRVQSQKAETTGIGGFEHERDVAERGVKHRESRPGPRHLGIDIQSAAEEGHAAELDPRRSQVVQAPPQALRHPALFEHLVEALAERANLVGPRKGVNLVTRELPGRVVEWRVTREARGDG